MNKKTLNYIFHHMGIPTTKIQPNERYSSVFKMHTSESGNSEFRIQYHRFEPGCPLHPLLQSMPHIAFKVPSIDEAIKDHHVILEPYFPFAGFRVTVIEFDGAPIELIETNLTEEQIWTAPQEKSYIYPD